MATIEVTGNAGSDVELKFINGVRGDFAVANFSLAETPREKKGDEWVDGETIWWKVSVTGPLAESLADAPLKGTRLFVKGDLKSFEYKGKDGSMKQGFEIRAKVVAQVFTQKRKAQTTTSTQAGDDSWPF